MFTVDEKWIPIINAITAGIFLLCFFRGWKKGVLRMLISLLGTIISLFGAWYLSPSIAKSFSLWPTSMTPLQDTLFASQVYGLFNRIACFFLLFILFRILFAVLDKIFKGLMKMPGFKQIMEILGGLLGIVEGVIWSMLLALLLSTPLFINGADAMDQSVLKTIQTTGNEVFSTAFKPLIEAEDTLRLISDAAEVAKENQGFLDLLSGLSRQ